MVDHVVHRVARQEIEIDAEAAVAEVDAGPEPHPAGAAVGVPPERGLERRVEEAVPARVAERGRPVLVDHEEDPMPAVVHDVHEAEGDPVDLVRHVDEPHLPPVHGRAARDVDEAELCAPEVARDVHEPELRALERADDVHHARELYAHGVPAGDGREPSELHADDVAADHAHGRELHAAERSRDARDPGDLHAFDGPRRGAPDPADLPAAQRARGRHDPGDLHAAHVTARRRPDAADLRADRLVVDPRRGGEREAAQVRRARAEEPELEPVHGGPLAVQRERWEDRDVDGDVRGPDAARRGELAVEHPEVVQRDRGSRAARDGDPRLREPPALVAHDAVRAGLDAELDRTPRELAQLGDEPVVAVAHEEPPRGLLGEHEGGLGAAQVREDDVAAPDELDVVGRVLRAAPRPLGPGERLAEGELVGLVDGHLAVPARVRRAAEPRQQEVREEGRADAVGLLGGLVRRARREDGVPLHRARGVHEERRARLAALLPRQRAGRARVDDRDPHLRADGREPAAHLLVRHVRAPQQEALVVRVARVVQDELGAARRVRGPDARRDVAERRAQRRVVGVEEQDLVRGGDPAEPLEHVRDVLGVGARVAQLHAVHAAVVHPGDEREAADGERTRRGRGGRGGGAEDRAQDEDGGHGPFSRTKSLQASPGGSAGVPVRAPPSAARRRIASSTGSTANGDPPVTRKNRSNAGASSSRYE